MPAKKISRCSCGAYIVACKNCGAVPQASQSSDIFDYRPTPARRARIDSRARELRCGRFGVGAFIDDCVRAA